jgi:CBS-domain-containing membrane protein
MQIATIMTSSPRTINCGATIGAAWELLRTLDLSHLPVTNQKGELVGLVSHKAFAAWPVPPFVARLPEDRKGTLNAPVSTLITGVPISVEPDDHVEDVVDLMIAIKADALAVVNLEDELVGIVTYLDVLRSLRDDARVRRQGHSAKEAAGGETA